MPSTEDRLAVRTDVDATTLQAVIRHGLVIGVLLVVGALVTVLPGASRELPGTAVAIESLLATAVAGAVFAAILLATPAVGALVRACVEGPPDVVDDLAGAARYGLVFVAVLVAYAGFAPTVVPLLAEGTTWMYDVAFLGFALFPVLAIGRRLYRSADPVALELARSMVETGGPDPGDGDAASSEGG